MNTQYNQTHKVPLIAQVHGKAIACWGRLKLRYAKMSRRREDQSMTNPKTWHMSSTSVIKAGQE